MDQDAPRPALRTIIADDDPLARRVVKAALQSAGVTVIAEAGTGREAVELAVHYRPDVVLMDIVMPDLNGLEATAQLAERAPDVKVVVLTASEDEELGLLGLRTGAVGFLNKDVDVDSLPRIIAGVADGQAAVSRELTLTLIERLRSTREGGIGMRPVRSVLTGREWEVLDLLCEGRTTDGIADELFLSTETVRSHVKSILRKLRVSSRQEAVQMADQLRQDGFVSESV
jgi:DNA-binding NarL/FixJ family response regulator